MSKAGNHSESRTLAQRISISLPDDVLRELDRMIDERGLENRSKTIVDMITQAVSDYHEDREDRIMAGTITLIYDESRGNILQKLAELERTHVDEVISSHHIQLQDSHRMEVILVQGPAPKLKRIADRMLACTGVRSGRLTLTSMIIPPLHPLPEDGHR